MLRVGGSAALRALAPATARTAAAVAVRPALVGLRFASLPAVAEQAPAAKEAAAVAAADKAAADKAAGKAAEAASSASSSAAATAATAAAAGEAKAKASGSSWQRFVAFLTGMGVSSLWFYYTISSDVWHSTAVIENSLAEFRGDMASTNRELRQRIATLEHQVAAMKKA